MAISKQHYFSEPNRKCYLACALLLACVLITALVSSDQFSRLSAANGADGRKRLPFKDADTACSCIWRISCAKYRWQVNFTSPRYTCGYEQLSQYSVNQCLVSRRSAYGRRLHIRVLGHIREAFWLDYIQRRLGDLQQTRASCRLAKAEPGQKPPGKAGPLYYSLQPLDGHAKTCYMSYENNNIKLEFKFVQALSNDLHAYLDGVERQCAVAADGCADDLLIISAGVGELLESTLLDSFSGVRRFQKQFQVLLPRLIRLATQHDLEVVWKIHEPVTDELIPEGSMVRNDLLQEYNALVMEQTMLTPVQVWTSHMIMKLHHIESCAHLNGTDKINSDPWRCEEEWVAGDLCHSDYFDAVFNKVCDRMIEMPENSCCSA